MQKTSNPKILVFGLLGLGDMVQFSPCFKMLRNGFPKSKITLFTIWKPVEELFEESPHIDEVIFFDFLKASAWNKLRFIKSLRQRRFDISILPYPSYRREFNLISRAVGARERYSFNFSRGRVIELGFLNNRRVDSDANIHNVENNLQLIRFLGLKPKGNEKYELAVTTPESFAKDFFVTSNIKASDLKIGMHPGSDSRTKGKRWDIRKFAELSDVLYERYGAKILVFFGPHEDELKNDFLQTSKQRHVMVEGTSIHQSARLISACDLFISSDSGLMHVASAMGIPTVAMFGPTDPRTLYPWGVKHEIVRMGLDCSPCFFFTERRPLHKPLIECRIDDKFACMKQIEIHSVLASIDRLLSLIRED